MIESIGITKKPMNPGDNGVAFAGFISFAFGNTPEAKALKREFCENFKSDGLEPNEVAGAFVDWLIVNQWGEAQEAEIAA